MKKLSFYWKELLSTFWFIPVLIVAIGVFLAAGFVFLDSQVQLTREGINQFLFVSSVSSARTVLSIISGAMIGVAGTVFSITLVALTLASSQFGSNLIRNFMYDRINQVVLGTYVSSFIYCLLVLSTIRTNVVTAFIPSFSVLFAQLVALANIILLILFIHNIAVSIQAERIISNISDVMSKRIKSLFPEKMGDEMDESKEQNANDVKSSYDRNIPLLAPRSGYLQYIDSESMFSRTSEFDGLLEANVRPGDYLVEKKEIGTIYMNALPEDKAKEQVISEIQSGLVIGKTRSYQQDAEYAIHQMVEIAVKALSPGINDPYTAIACIDNLSNIMSYLAGVRFQSKFRYDEEGTLRLISDPVTYEGMLDTAFNEIRQFSRNTPSVVIRLMEAFITINHSVRRPEHKAAIQKHAAMVLNMAKESFGEPNDLRDLEERSKLLLEDLDVEDD